MRIWVTGWCGMLGSHVVRAAALRGHAVRGSAHKDCPIDDVTRVWETAQSYRPDAIINCVGKLPGGDPLEMVVANALGPHVLATTQIRLVHMSTDSVGSPDLYSRTKLAGESDEPHALNVRGTFIGKEGGFLRWLMDAKGEVEGWTQVYWNGTTVAVMAEKLVDLAEGDRTGGVNVASAVSVTKAWLVAYFKEALGLPITIRESDEPQVRRVLESHVQLPALDDALRELVEEIKR